MHIIKASGNLVMIGTYKKINIWEKETLLSSIATNIFKYIQMVISAEAKRCLFKLILKNTLLLYYNIVLI